MPNNQEIVLNLMAKLDQGNIQSEVQNMAQSIATSLETAFDSIGQRIAQQIMRGAQQGFQGLASSLPSQFQGFTQAPSGIFVPGGGPAPAGVPTTTQVGPPPTAPLPVAPNAPVNLAAMPGGFAAPAAVPGAAAMAGLEGAMVPRRLGRALAGDVSDFGYEIGGFDARFAEARAIVAARKSGANIDVPEDQRTRMKETQEDIKKTQEALVKEIIELNETIKKNNTALKDAPEEQKAVLKERIQKDMADREEARRQSERLAEGSKDIGRAISAEGGVGMMGKVGGYALAAQQLGESLVQMPGALRRREVALGEMGNFAARAAMTGDVERLMLAQQLGGIEDVQGGAWWEQLGKTGVAGLGILGGVKLGGMVGTALGPGVGSAAGAAIGGAIGLGNFALTAMGFTPGQRTGMEERLAAEKATNPEYYAAMARARGIGMGGFQAARGLGAPEMAEFMAGGGASVESLMAQQAAVRAQAARMVPSIAEVDPATMATSYHRTVLEERELARLESQAAAFDPRIAEARKYSIGDQSLRGYAAGFGVGPEQLSEIMARSFGAMGGNFLGQTPQLMQNMGGLGQMARLAGLGFGQAPEVAGALVQGGMGRGEAMEATRQMYEDAVAAGLDKARVGQSMMTVASRVEQLGVGGARTAMAEQTMALGAAQQYALQTGAPGIEGAAAGFMQRGVQTMQQLTYGQSGLGMIGGYEAAREFTGRLNKMLKQGGQKQIGFSALDMADIQELEMSPDAMERMLEKRGVTVTDEMRGLIREMPSIRQRQMQRTFEIGSGLGKRGGEFLATRAMGARTLTEKEMAETISAQARSGMMGVDIGIDASEIDQFGYDEAQRRAQERAREKIQTPITGTPAGKMAVTEAQRAALEAGAGMQTLDTQAKTLATAFEALVERTNQVFAEKGGKTESQKSEAPFDFNAMFKTLTGKGASSSLPATGVPGVKR